MADSLNDLHFHTDGACPGNQNPPKPMGAGIVTRCGDTVREWGVPLGDGTNQKAELLAVKEALLRVSDRPGSDVTVHTDSEYAIGCLTKNWKVKVNTRIVAEVRALIRECGRFRMTKVAGHSGHVENERADELASEAARTGQPYSSESMEAPVERPPGAERLIVALDTGDPAQAGRWVAQLGPLVGAVKVGMELFHAAGPRIFEQLRASGAERIFYDGKLCDIPNTVAGAMRGISRLDIWLTNVHALGGREMMAAAKEAAGEEGPRVIAVTLLTSLDEKAVSGDLGLSGSPEENVRRLALLAWDAGLDGVVASPLEVAAIREACGPDFLIVTPGVRPAGTETHDQARVATPGEAIRAGADYLVVGRAITRADDPVEAAAAIAAEIAAAAE